MSNYGFSHFVDAEYSDLTVQNILRRESEYSLWEYYLGRDFKLNQTFSAPNRKDNKPSFCILQDRRGRLMYSDFGKAKYGDVFNYIQDTYGCGFLEALRRVNEDFKLGLKEGSRKEIVKPVSKEVQLIQPIEKKTKEQKLQINARAYRQEDLDYWMSYGITHKTLLRYNVYCVEKLFLNGDMLYADTKINPCYVYHFPVTDHLKCYFPLSSRRRWLSNVDNLKDIQGYYQCDVKKEGGNELLILTKSMKDVMVLRELGYDSMAINGEGHRFCDDFIRHVKKYYSCIISLYDLDETGIRGSRYLWKSYGIRPYFIPREARKAGCKDISDTIRRFDRRMAEGFLGTIVQDLHDKRLLGNAYTSNKDSFKYKSS